MDDLDLYITRSKIQPRKVKGLFQNIRVTTIWITLSWYFIAPWITFHDRQALLFDLPNRKFYIFNWTFWPQDFIYLTALLIIAALSLFFFTTLAGRLWCGYTCPQTVWTRFYLWIENFTEGNRNQRIKLDKSPWGIKKIYKRGSKHFLWLLLAFYTGFTFIGYFTPIKILSNELIHLRLGPWEFFWIGFFTLATYINAGWMREQVCLYMCPYARFQSVMFDKNTLIISYDESRGEPRGQRKKGSDYLEKGFGQCVDCNQCVQVCPTGIDIRDGLQAACIGCAACIDACNNIMDIMQYPKNLIRYTTENNLKQGKTRILRPLLISYGLILITVIGLLFYALSQRLEFAMDVLREKSALYTETNEGLIENVYTLKIMNKSQNHQIYSLQADGLPSLKIIGKSIISVDAGELALLPIRLQADPFETERRSTLIHFTLSPVNSDDVIVVESRFIAPSMR